MKQRGYIITSLMRQLTAGGGSEAASAQEPKDKKEARDDLPTPARDCLCLSLNTFYSAVD